MRPMRNCRRCAITARRRYRGCSIRSRRHISRCNAFGSPPLVSKGGEPNFWIWNPFPFLVVELRSVAHDLDIGVLGDEDRVVFHLGAVVERIDGVEQDGTGVICLDFRQIVRLSNELVKRTGHGGLLRLTARGGGVSWHDAEARRDEELRLLAGILGRCVFLDCLRIFHVLSPLSFTNVRSPRTAS